MIQKLLNWAGADGMEHALCSLLVRDLTGADRAWMLEPQKLLSAL